MTPKELKNSILQLAIEGKLVKQRKEEGSAETLYAEIQKEKQKLIKQGKNKKEKELPEITDDEIPFEIPKSWKWVRLGEIADVIRGLTFSECKKELKKGYTMVLRGGNIDSATEKLVFDDNIYVNSNIIKKEQYIKKGDCLIVASSGTKTSIGKSSYIDKEFINTSFGGFMMVVRSNKFIEPYLISAHIKLYRQKIISLTAGYISNITNPILNNLLIPLPPLAEQKRIVAKIEELMPLVDRYEVLYNRLNELNKKFPKKLKNAILQKAIEGKLVPQIKSEGSADDLYKEIQKEKQKLIKQGKIKKEKELPEITEDEVPFEIPKNWKWCRLGECGMFISGYTPKISEITEKGDIPYFKVSDMNSFGNEKYLKYSNNYVPKTIRRVFDKNTIVYPKNGGAIFTNKRRILFSNSVVDLNTGGFKPYEIIFLNYAFLFIDMLDFQFYYKGTALPTLDMEKIINIMFPLPPYDEQKRIVEKIEEILPKIEKLEKYN